MNKSKVMKTQISLSEKIISVLCHGSITIEQSDGCSYYCFKACETETLSPIYLDITAAFDVFICYVYDKIVGD